MKLTDVAIRKAKPRTKPYKKADGGGLFLQVQPNGSKYWRLFYRFEGKQKLLALGVYPDVSLLLARERRDVARKLLATGTDPSENRKAKKKASQDSSENSFEVVAREWLAFYMKNKVASHSEKVIRRFERFLFPWLGSKPIADITPPQVLEAVKRIENLGSFETAHRTLQACG
ncbi:MAG: tyrosine-type recombinase/integrase, partial [Nitrosomonadaceae bacterium]